MTSISSGDCCAALATQLADARSPLMFDRGSGELRLAHRFCSTFDVLSFCPWCQHCYAEVTPRWFEWSANATACCDELSVAMTAPRVPFTYGARLREWIIEQRASTTVGTNARFCPYSGAEFPGSMRVAYFDRIRELGFEYPTLEMTDDWLSDRWWSGMTRPEQADRTRQSIQDRSAASDWVDSVIAGPVDGVARRSIGDVLGRKALRAGYRAYELFLGVRSELGAGMGVVLELPERADTGSPDVAALLTEAWPERLPEPVIAVTLSGYGAGPGDEHAGGGPVPVFDLEVVGLKCFYHGIEDQVSEAGRLPRFEIQS